MLVLKTKIRSWMDFRAFFDFDGVRSRKDYIIAVLIIVATLFGAALAGLIALFAINFFVILIHYSLIVLLLTAAYNWALMSITVQRLRHIGITDIFKQVACIIVTALLPFLVFLWMVWPGDKR
jgi:uncharacterized membrane protein YhaH (DUF805 family)